MEESLKFNSQVCTTKIQSQRLLELGLKPETADMYHTTFYRDNVGYEIIQVRNEKLPLLSQELPAWSLHRLLFLYGQDYTIKEVYNDAEECYGMLISAIEMAIENDEFNEKYLDK